MDGRFHNVALSTKSYRTPATTVACNPGQGFQLITGRFRAVKDQGYRSPLHTPREL